MSKLDDTTAVHREFGVLSFGDVDVALDETARDQIKVLMLDTILEAVKDSNGEAADIIDQYREKVAEL